MEFGEINGGRDTFLAYQLLEVTRPNYIKTEPKLLQLLIYSQNHKSTSKCFLITSPPFFILNENLSS